MLFAITNILLVFSLVTCVIALLRGGPAERLGAAIILANLLASIANEAVFHIQLFSLANDALAALLLLAVALRYASVWLGAVMLLYGLQFALHAYYSVLERPRDNLHVVLNNADFFAVSLCLAAGTVVAWRRRARAPRLAAQAAP